MQAGLRNTLPMRAAEGLPSGHGNVLANGHVQCTQTVLQDLLPKCLLQRLQALLQDLLPNGLLQRLSSVLQDVLSRCVLYSVPYRDQNVLPRRLLHRLQAGHDNKDN